MIFGCFHVETFLLGQKTPGKTGKPFCFVVSTGKTGPGGCRVFSIEKGRFFGVLSFDFLLFHFPCNEELPQVVQELVLLNCRGDCCYTFGRTV